METKNETLTEQELAQINKYTRRTLTADEVYTFGVVLCDNEIDRDLERFDSEALPVLAELFVGKTGIFDHCPSAKNQRARIYSAQCLTDESRKTRDGENYRYINAMAYIPKTPANSDLIEEIESGIKKEVSVGCSMARVTCSVCGEELRTGKCGHKRGRSYGGKVCHAVLQEPADAYEWSFVAVPAQPLAGVSKEGRLGGYAVTKKISVYDSADAPESGDPFAEPELIACETEKMRGETKRLAMAVIPALSEDTAKAICARLSFAQCLDFTDALREKQSLPRPGTPQLAPPQSGAVEINEQFRI
jgi:hypothetical protein